MATEPEKRRESSEHSNFSDGLIEAGKKRSGVTLRPLTPGMDAQWKAGFHESVQPRALKLQEVRVEKLKHKSRQQKKAEEKEPADHLSQDWFNTESMTLETRAYLLDKLIPTLVPAVEKLLRVAERKKVLDMEEFEPHLFDPINFLGEYLIRHNPAYDLTAQPNPYVRGLKEITNKLKTLVPDTTMHKLAQMKTLVEEKRQRRKDTEKIKTQVNNVRKEALAMQFQEWILDASGQMPLALVQSALKSFLEVISPVHRQKGAEIYARSLEAVGTLEVKVNQEEFIEYLLSYVKNFTSDMFQEMLKHLLQCANDTRNIIRQDIWRQMFLQLFFDCDHGKIGLLARSKILSLLERFYGRSLEVSQQMYRDPRKWPIVELDDINLVEFWGDMEPEEKVEDFPEIHPPSPELTLSKEAFVLSLQLKEILSDMDLPIQDEYGAPEEPAAETQEDTGLEQQVTSVQVESEVTPITASQEQAEVAAAEMEPQGAETQEEPLPASEATSEPAAEVEPQGAETQEEPPQASEATSEPGAEVEPQGAETQEEPLPASKATSEPAVEGAEDQPGPALEPGLEREDTAGESKEKKPSPLSLTKVADQVQEILAEEESAGPEVPAEERDIPAKEMGADEAGLLQKPEDQTEPEGEGLPCPSPEDQAAAGTSKPTGITVTKLPSLPTQRASKKEEKKKVMPQLVYGEVWSGDFQMADLTFKYTDYGKDIQEDWNTENSRFSVLRMNMMEIGARGPPSSTSSFDKESLNLPQFVQLMETFVGDGTSLLKLRKLVEFLKRGYVQKEKEKFRLLEGVHHASFLARKQLLLQALFEKWDNECSGFLEMQEVDAVLSTFKEGMEEKALNKAKLQLPFPNWHPSGIVKLMQKDLQSYVELVVSELAGNEDKLLDDIVEFLMMAAERDHMERLRGSARRKWLLQIQQAAVTSGGCMELIYRAVFKALKQDTEAHGSGKIVSASIALLEYNVLAPERGDILLRYVACTEADAPYVLNQILFMDMEGVSFAAALDDKPIHVPRVQLHGNIHFWNYDRPPSERKGSFLVLPLEDIRRRVFGVLGLDTLRDTNEKTIFLPHEIRFYQGLAHSFSIAYHYIRTQESLMQVILTALGWLTSRSPGLQSITAYFMEPGDNKMQDYSLRQVMTSDLKGEPEVYPQPAPILTRKENVFKDYLFKCIDCSLVVPMKVYDEYHTAVPLRNPTGQAIALLDLNLGHCPQLMSCAHRDVQKMLKMAQCAIYEILKEDSGDLEPYYVLGLFQCRFIIAEAEYVGDWRRGGVLFYRFMLQDLQNCIWNLDPWLSFGDIKSLEKPPALVHTILKSVLLILYPQWTGTKEVENWPSCIQKLDAELIENICYFDPTASYVEIRPEVLYNCLQGIHRRAVWKFGLVSLEYFYNWACACLSLIEMAGKLQRRQSTPGSSFALLTPSFSQSLRSSQVSTYRTTSLI